MNEKDEDLKDALAAALAACAFIAGFTIKWAVYASATAAGYVLGRYVVAQLIKHGVSL